MIGFFGDSFIDANHEHSWPKLIEQTVNEPCKFYGLSGTSQWFSYELFIDNFAKFDTIIFCHTSHVRWPALPKKYHGKQFNIGYADLKTDWYMQQVNAFYQDVFPKNLTKFLCENIGKSVNELCKVNNKFLINLIPFKLPYDIDTDFPVLKGLSDISKNEVTTTHNKKEYITKWLEGKNIVDPRPCHLNYENNIKLNNIVKELILEKKYNIKIDLNNLDWNKNDIMIDQQLKELYEKSISNR